MFAGKAGKYVAVRGDPEIITGMSVGSMNHEMAKNPWVLRIGVTGHRANRLQSANMPLLVHSIGEAIESIAALTSGSAFTLLSPLADGADQVVARQAVDAGHRLWAVLPFERNTYSAGLSPGSVKPEFDSLLGQAERVIELNGSHACESSRNNAYAAVGRFVIDHSDILLAVWDGQEARGEGGTGENVSLALEARHPVVWISSQLPHQVRVLKRTKSGASEVLPLDNLPDVISPRGPLS
jgi:hypothetical protein